MTCPLSKNTDWIVCLWHDAVKLAWESRLSIQAMQSNPVKKQRVPNTERRRLSTKAVLDSALELFVTRGYDATSIDDIASQAGLTKGAQAKIEAAGGSVEIIE